MKNKHIDEILENFEGEHMEKMPELKIGNLISKLPIIQGGMGVGISLSGLASAVANEGGVGVIATADIGMYEQDYFSNFLEANIRALRKEIRKAREKTNGILGVNIMVALTNFSDMVEVSIEEGVDIIFSGAGLPLNLPKFLKKGSKTKLVPIVSSARAANILIKRWINKYDYVPDAVVVEGPKAGGHLGFKQEQINDPKFSLKNILNDVIQAIKKWEEKLKKSIPVIAAGGIFTGNDIHNILQLGASGVQLGTRFVATEECDASPEFKQAYLTAKKEDIVIIKSPVGMPGRAIRNKYLDDVSKGEKKPFNCPYHCIISCDYKKVSYCISLALINAQKGKLDNGFAFAGSNAYRIDKIIFVRELMQILKNEYERLENFIVPM